MNKRRTIIETTILSLLIIVLYVVTFTLLLTYSKSKTYDTLKSTSDIVQNVFNGNDETDSIEKLNNTFDETSSLRISIIIRNNDNKYTILYDNKKMYNAENTPNELENINQYYTRKSSYGYNMIYYTILDNENGKYYIRTSIKESDTTSMSKNFLIFGLPILIIILLGFIFYKIYEYNKSIKPLKKGINELKIMSGDTNIENSDDVIILSNSINLIKDNLNQKIQLLNEEKEKTQMILDSLSEGLLVISEENKIIMLNKAVKDIISLDKDYILDKDYNLLPLDDNFKENIIKCFQNRNDFSFDIKKENKIYQVHLNNICIKINNKDINCVAIILFDVTETRNTSKIKNDFFANASHELKTPLTSIIGYQELLANKIITDPSDVEKAIDITIKQAKKIDEILKDMLSISKLENNEITNKEELNVKNIIEQIISDENFKISQHNINFKTNLSDLIIVSNKDDIYKLLSNLIDNAIKYNKEGGTVEINIDSNAKKVEIKDTGIGIKDEDISRIFERFYRVDNSKDKNNVEGTGLGLAIVKHIVDKYGYKIDVSSSYLIGSTFTLTLK